MGVRGLQRALKDIGNPVNLIDIAKQRRLTFLVDFYAFSFFVAETFVSYDPEGSLLLDADPLRRYEFCELSKLRSIVLVLIDVLRRHNIDLEFVGDGAYKLGTEEGETKKAEWERRSKERSDVNRRIEQAFLSRDPVQVRCIYSDVSYNVSIPPMFHGQIQHTLRELQCPIWFAEGEADKLLAEITRQRSSNSSTPLSTLPPIFAILSNDSDFAIMKGCHLILFNSFDSTRQLVSVVSSILQFNRQNLLDPTFRDFKIDHQNSLQHLNTLLAPLHSPETVARLLQIKVDVLPELSILAGNDFTRDFIDRYKSPNLPPPGHVPKAAQALRSIQKCYPERSVRVDDIHLVKRLLINDSEFQRAVDFSRAFYGYNSGDEEVHEHLRKLELDEYTKWRVLFERRKHGNASVKHESNTTVRAKDADHRDQDYVRFIVTADDLMKTNDVSQNVNESKTLLRRNCCLGVFPRFALQVTEGHTYWIQNKIEFIEASQFGIEDAFVALRTYLYSVMGIPSHTAVTEYGRVGRNLFSIVRRQPLIIPQDLTWFAVKEASQTDSEAADKSLAKIFTMIIRLSKPTFRFVSSVNVSTIFLALINTLQFKTDTSSPRRSFLHHEIESIVLSMILCVMHINPLRIAVLDDVSKDMVDFFRIPDSIMQIVTEELIQSGYDQNDDPINFLNNRMQTNKGIRRCPELNGLVCGFRSITVFGWFQAIWQSLMDFVSMYYGAATGCRMLPSFALLLNGNIFRWIYAAGALDWKTNGAQLQNEVEASIECLPIEILPQAKNQLRFVTSLRSLLLQQEKVHRIFQHLG